MATVAEEPRTIAPAADLDRRPAQRFVVDAASWDGYEWPLKGLGNRPIRATHAPNEVARQIAPAGGTGHSQWGRLVRARVRETVLPLDEAENRPRP